MKRFVVLSAALFVASSSFAYYDSYSSSSGLLTFMGVIMMVWGILEIILFFKIWGMTNDIKALKKDHFNETAFESKDDLARYIRTNMLLGNMENVKKALLKNFINNVEQGYNNLPTGEYATDDKGNKEWVDLDETKKLNNSIVQYVNNLKLQYDKIGEEVPAYLLNMKTFKDYYMLFEEEDLIVVDWK